MSSRVHGVASRPVASGFRSCLVLHLSLATKVLAPRPPWAASVLVCAAASPSSASTSLSLAAGRAPGGLSLGVEKRPEDGTRAARAPGAEEAMLAGPGTSALGDEACLLARTKSACRRGDSRWEVGWRGRPAQVALFSRSR